MADRLDRNNIAVVIPALNEALRIRGVVEGALAECPNVILVDDGSDDATLERVAGLPITVLRHSSRLGKGASLRDGFQQALRSGFKAIVTMDGDGQHSASDIPRMIDAANCYPDHVVIGARMRRRARQPRYRRLANAFGDWGIAWGTGYQVADSQSGQRLYPAAVAALDDVPGDDFVFEAQILISAARQLNTRCVSIPIESRYQSVAPDVAVEPDAPRPPDESFRRSHFRPIRDFTRITVHIVLQSLHPLKMPATYRRIRANPPVIHDPSGEFASAPMPQTAASS